MSYLIKTLTVEANFFLNCSPRVHNWECDLNQVFHFFLCISVALSDYQLLYCRISRVSVFGSGSVIPSLTFEYEANAWFRAAFSWKLACIVSLCWIGAIAACTSALRMWGRWGNAAYPSWCLVVVLVSICALLKVLYERRSTQQSREVLFILLLYALACSACPAHENS